METNKPNQNLVSHTGIGTCKRCNHTGPKIIQKVYANGSYHATDDQGKAWNGGLCPKCYAEHRRLSRKQHTSKEMKCEHCGTMFMSKNKVQRHCSKKCQKKAYNIKAASQTNDVEA